MDCSQGSVLCYEGHVLKLVHWHEISMNHNRLIQGRIFTAAFCERGPPCYRCYSNNVYKMGHCDNSSPVLSNHEAPCQQWLKLRCQKWFSMKSYNDRKFLYLPQFIWSIRSSSTSIRASLYPEDGEGDRWSCVSHESYKWFSMESYNGRKFLYLPQFIWPIRSSSTSIRASLYPEDGERDRWSCVSHESYKGKPRAQALSLALSVLQSIVEEEGQKFVENLSTGYVGSSQAHSRSVSSRLYDFLDMIFAFRLLCWWNRELRDWRF